MRRILFVDDQLAALRDLVEHYRARSADWGVEVASSPEQAWKLVCQQAFDVVVQGVRAGPPPPGDLLTRVMNRHPDSIRIVLTAQKDRDAVLRMLGPAHQYMSRPCPPALLDQAIESDLRLRDLLANEQLRRLVSQMQSLPSMPSLYLELLNLLSGEDPSVEEVAQIISRDLGMCTKLLQLVNSAFFGMPQSLSNPMEAVVYLGIDTVKALVLSLQIFALFERSRIPGFSYETLWSHCWRCGAMARRIAVAARLPHGQVDQAFTAGLLHDVGKLILATGLPTQYRTVIELQHQQQWPAWQAEMQVFGSTHAETGAYLLCLWGLPTSVVDAVAWHHAPERSQHTEPSPLMAVHLANVYEHELNPGPAQQAGFVVPSVSYLMKLGVTDRLSEWRQRAVDTEGIE